MRVFNWLSLTLLLCSGHSLAGDAVTPEYKVKAGFLFNFIAFAKWPETTEKGLQLCIHGENPFGSAAYALSVKKIHGTALRVRETSTLIEIKDCSVIFVTRTNPQAMLAIANAVAGKPVLTVADETGALDQGIGINMISRADRIAFEVGLPAIERNGLELSSKLLSLAAEVR